jgi:hypothetical protein
MLDRVEVNVVDAALKIPVVAYGVFPETLLPERIFATTIA